MNSKECEEQLKSLIEHFDNGGLDFNATDIEAIKHLMLENQIQQDTIKTQKLVIDNLSERITKAIEYINDNLIISSILDCKKYYTLNNYSFDYRELLEILKEEQ